MDKNIKPKLMTSQQSYERAVGCLPKKLKHTKAEKFIHCVDPKCRVKHSEMIIHNELLDKVKQALKKEFKV